MPTKVRKLKKMIRDGKRRIGFITTTPESERDIPVQSVIVRDAYVWKSKSGNWLIRGRDIGLEQLDDMKNGHVVKEEYRRPKQMRRVRDFRIDRILDGSIVSN
jgi:hypothetical protein